MCARLADAKARARAWVEAKAVHPRKARRWEERRERLWTRVDRRHVRRVAIATWEAHMRRS
jgi:hypothetical protein